MTFSNKNITVFHIFKSIPIKQWYFDFPGLAFCFQLHCLFVALNFGLFPNKGVPELFQCASALKLRPWISRYSESALIASPWSAMVCMFHWFLGVPKSPKGHRRSKSAGYILCVLESMIQLLRMFELCLRCDACCRRISFKMPPSILSWACPDQKQSKSWDCLWGQCFRGPGYPLQRLLTFCF